MLQQELRRRAHVRGGVDAGRQRRFRHDPAVPDGIQYVVLADHAIAVLDEVEQEIEDLRLDGHRRTRFSK